MSQQLQNQDKGLWKKIKGFFSGLVERLKKAYAGMTPDSAIARETKRLITQSEAIRNAWVDAVSDSVVNYQLQDGQKKNAREGVKYSEREMKYSYEYFINKPDMAITTVDETQNIDRTSIIQAALLNAKEVGRTNENGNAVVYVNDIGRDIIIGKKAVSHGLDRRTSTQAPVLVRIGNVLENAIRLNELNPRSENIKESYVLVGAAQSKAGLYVATFVVNRHSNEITSIDVLYAANAKKEPAALLPKITEESATPTGSKISIAKLLDVVNELYPDILPEDVLKHYGHRERPNGKLGESALYSSRTQQDKQLDRLVVQNEKLRQETEYLRQLVQIQKSGNKSYVLDRNSVKQQAKVLMDTVNAKGTSEFSGLLNDFYRQLTTEDMDYETMTNRAGELADWLLAGGRR